GAVPEVMVVAAGPVAQGGGRAARRGVKPEQHPEERRLPCTVGAEDRHELPRRHGGVQTSEEQAAAGPGGDLRRLHRHGRRPGGWPTVAAQVERVHPAVARRLASAHVPRIGDLIRPEATAPTRPNPPTTRAAPTSSTTRRAAVPVRARGAAGASGAMTEVAALPGAWARASARLCSSLACHSWNDAPFGVSVSVTVVTGIPTFFALVTRAFTSGVEFCGL